MIFAHGVGSRGDLPLPLWMFTWASAVALALSFVALGTLWTTPRLAKAGEGRSLFGQTLPSPVRAVQVVGQAAALLLFVVAIAAGLFGTNETGNNLMPVTLYVVVWVGAQVVGGLVGDIWRSINPLYTLAAGMEKVTGRRREQSDASLATPPSAVGQWWAAAGLFGFLFLELVHPTGSTPRTLGIAVLAHALISLGFAWFWGTRWLQTHEPFSALFTWIGEMAPITSNEGGGLRRRPLMSGLARMPVETGTVWALLIVLGGTTFDGFAESEVGRDLFDEPEGWGAVVPLTLGLIGSIIVVAALYSVGIWWTRRVTGFEFAELRDAFAPSLVPIVFGYAIAHYAQLLVDEVQSFVFRLSDPFGIGWDLFGGADGTIDFTIISVDLIAWIQVLAILFGHIGAVTVAHDRSVELFPAKDSLRSQFAMLLVMVGYSTLGLWLLMNA